MDKNKNNKSSKPKRHLKNYLLDKKFQLTYSLIISAVSILLTALLGYLVFRQTKEAAHLHNTQSQETINIFKKQASETIDVFQKTSKKTEEVFTQQSNKTRKVFKKKSKTATDILNLLKAIPEMKEMAEETHKELKKDDKKDLAELDQQIKKSKTALKKELRQGMKAKEKQLDKALAKIKKDIAHQRQVRKRNNTKILWGVVIFSLIFIIVIFLYTIVLTHKVAGPLFKISLYFKKIENNDLGKIWPLRKGDQLQDFYKKFSAAYNSIVDRNYQELHQLEKALEMSENKGVTEVLHKIIEAKKVALHLKKNDKFVKNKEKDEEKSPSGDSESGEQR
ncbi:MAG: hypothetical protein ACQES9_07535 [Myxococcota bacterium]